MQRPSANLFISNTLIFFPQLVFCDDVYNLLYFENTSPKRLFAYDNPSDQDYDGGRVVSNGTFSKILSPGIRVGWIEAGPRIRDQLKSSGVLSSGGSLNNVMSGFISSALQLGLQGEHVQYLRELYRQRMLSVKSVFEKYLPKKFDCKVPGGGYFLWITGPPDFDAKAFSLFCKEQFKVSVLPGVTCCPCDSTNPAVSCSNAFRLSIAFYEETDLIVGAKRLCSAAKIFGEN
jgi:DNA-binding transcriptional MocR family regulator